jgi:hypothetical protein
VAKRWLGAAKKFTPVLDPNGKRHVDDELNLYYFALVAYSLGEEGHGRLLPATKAEERITWSGEGTRVINYLLKVQDLDGGWDSEHGGVYATAIYLTILQLDYGLVPIYHR